MMSINRLLCIAMMGIGTLVVDTSARADTVFVSGNEMGPYGVNSYAGGTLGTYIGGGNYQSDYNGQMILTANAGSSLSASLFRRSVWCIDQIGYIGLGNNPSVNNTPIVYQVGSLADFTTDSIGNGISATQAGQIAALAYIGDRMLSVSASDVIANAIQAAITNIEYGTTSDGGAAVNAETQNLMNWVTSLTSSQLSSYNAVIYTDVSGDRNQTLIASMPEPSSILLVGVAIAALNHCRRSATKPEGHPIAC